jgi:hypothetical protein
MPHAWEELPYRGDECASAWQYLSNNLAFLPSVSSQHWPGIREPYPSMTYAIGHIYNGDGVEATRLEEDLTRKTLIAFRVCTHTCTAMALRARLATLLLSVLSASIIPSRRLGSLACTGLTERRLLHLSRR